MEGANKLHFGISAASQTSEEKVSYQAAHRPEVWYLTNTKISLMP